MGEIINLSFSQNANHVVTHLYNQQELHIPYKKNTQLFHDNTTFLTAVKQNGRVNYSPRALIYDLIGGYGSLNRFEYSEKSPQINIDQRNIIHTHEEVPKNLYQKNLDKGINTPDILNSSNTTYWSDYNKLIYSPKSLNQLDNWKYSNPGQYGIHKNFNNMKFSTYNLGQSEFKNEEDHHLDLVRRYLEECDLLQGINVFSEIDSGWGGFANEYIINVRDEFFNNSSKYNIWSYGVQSSTKPRMELMASRIRTMIEFSKNSSLFFPIDINAESSIIKDYESNSLWHSSSIPALFINSIWGMNNQFTNPQSMNWIEDNALRGYGKINIVNEIKINKFPNSDSSIQDVTADLYSNPYLVDESNSTTDEEISLGLSKSKSTRYFSKNFITKEKLLLKDSLGTDHESITNIYENKYINEMFRSETLPKIYTTDNIYTQFAITTSIIKELKTYRKFLSNYHMKSEVLEDKSELIEDVSEIIEEYSIDYDDSDEEFD